MYKGNAAASSACGEQFNGIKLLPDARYCRVYDAKNPAAITYFTPVTMSEAVRLYQQQSAFQLIRQSAYSIALIPPAAPYRIILNQDPNGTQVSILHSENLTDG